MYSATERFAHEMHFSFKAMLERGRPGLVSGEMFCRRLRSFLTCHICCSSAFLTLQCTAWGKCSGVDRSNEAIAKQVITDPTTVEEMLDTPG